ncbi:MAG: T9SS type A sorting domain-containing protein [Bacteroidales bacterium]|jgi:hypothetical protein|nr:T9SS type A sorting domain-containing protein [Bacteroidales bacterium]
MKKIIILISLLFCTGALMSQIDGSWPPEHYDSWLFPEFFDQGCASLPVDPSEFYMDWFDPTHNNAPAYIGSPTIGFEGQGGLPELTYFTSLAQPYFIDSVISIKGVAVVGYFIEKDVFCERESPYQDSAYYFQIRDSAYNVLAQTRYDTTSAYLINNGVANAYRELFFDSTIFITPSKFYASVTVPYYGSCLIELHILSFFSNDTCFVTELPSALNGNKWSSFSEMLTANFVFDSASKYSTLCIFPILDTLVYRRDAIVEATNAEYNEITSSMNISIFPLDLGYPLPDSLGVVYIKSDSSLLDINNPLCNIISSTFIEGQGVYNYEISFDSILCDTTYFFKPFIVNSNGIIYGQVDSFKKQCFNSGLIDANNNENKIKIHPNPAKDYIIIDCLLENKEILTFTLYDNKGINVLSQELNNSKTNIDTRKFFSGAYYYRITNTQNKVIKSGKIILSK